MQTLQIDPEFQSLIPPLAEDERAELEASLKAEGCRHPLDVWQGVIVDGHNRYAICQANGIPFEVAEHEFEDRDAAKEWILRNQLARRNLNDYSRGALALRLKGVIAARAKARMLAGKPADPPVNLPEGKGDTRDALGAAAGVSGRTIDRVEAVERDAPEPVKVAARAGDISTNRAYEITRALQDLPEADRARAAEICIDHDEKARTLVRLHKSQDTDPDSNGTYEEILRTGGFHYGDDLEKWCDFAKASVSEINEALRSLAKYHKAEAMRRKREDALTLIAVNAPQSVQLYHDDALLRLPQLDDGSIALVIADPPYNVTEHAWDKIGGEPEYLDFTRAWLAALKPKLAQDYHLYIFCSPHYAAPVEMLLRVDGWPLKSRIVWSHRNLSMGRDASDKYITMWEMCFHIGTHPLNHSPVWDDERFEVKEVAAPQSNFYEGKHHPTAKPVDLIRQFVRHGSKPGDVVLDPFAGGGTTGAACAEEGQRRCILIEKEAAYCDVISKRLGLGDVLKLCA